MKVGVFFPDGNQMHRTTLAAFAEGLRVLGADYFIEELKEDYTNCDLAIVFGVGKKSVPISYLRGRIIDKQKFLKKKTIVLERGYIKREEYFAAGFDGLNGHADFKNKNMLSDRWQNLNIKLQTHKTGKNKNIALLIGQVPTDASVQHMNIFDWCYHTAKQIREWSEYKVVFRPHPLALDRTPAILGTHLSTHSLEKDLEEAVCVITYNSNTAVEAVIQGIPTYACDNGSMAWDVTGHDLKEFLNKERFPLRNRWAYDLAYAQWTHEEMASGFTFKHLTRDIL